MSKKNDSHNFTEILHRAGDFFVNTNQSNHAYASLFFWWPIILWAVAIVPLLIISDFNAGTTIFGGTFALFASVFIGWLLHRQHITTIDRLLLEQEKLLSSDSSFHAQIFPVWSRQINTSRVMADSAVNKITGLFSGIVSKLEAMLKISRSGAHSEAGNAGYEKDFLDAVASSQSDIKSVLSDLKIALETVNDSKDLLLAEVTMYSAKMKEMADESNLVAFQSQIIALNAEIEAARAGVAGRAFAAVVAEMRQLARKSSETSKKMSFEVSAIDAAMTRYYAQDKEMTEKEAQYLTSAEAMFNDVMARFNKVTVELEESIATMGTSSQEIRDDISTALVQFQFQDRVSQILDHVAENIDELTEADAQNLDADAWLNEMKTKFSVDEEHGNLSGDQTASTQPSKLTFF